MRVAQPEVLLIVENWTGLKLEVWLGKWGYYLRCLLLSKLIDCV